MAVAIGNTMTVDCQSDERSDKWQLLYAYIVVCLARIGPCSDVKVKGNSLGDEQQ